nr:hypothetical protein [Woeseiaceae bacterium]
FDGDDAAGVPQSAFNEFQDFHEMSVDDQIAAASVIVLIEFEAADDGRMKAVISEILKETDGADFSYAVGDEYHSHSYYPGDRYSKEREVIFFTGTPARMRYSTTYTGDRITGLNNMPLELFLEKCAEAAESSETT